MQYDDAHGLHHTLVLALVVSESLFCKHPCFLEAAIKLS
jgi:hypothetical protein